MNIEAAIRSIEGQSYARVESLNGLMPKTPLDHAVFATIAFLAGELDIANRSIITALDLRPDLVVTNVLAKRIFRYLDCENFLVTSLHPWFGLQWLSQPPPTLTPEMYEFVGTKLLNSTFDSRLCKAKIFEQICEMRLRRSSLADAATSSWLKEFLINNSDHAPSTSALYQACMDHFLGSRDTAEKGFIAFASAGYPKSHASLGATSYLASPGMRSINPKGFRVAALAKGDIVVVAADPVYFAKWSGVIISCLKQAPENVSVHFHIIGNIDIALINLSQGLNGRVGLSFEEDFYQDKAYYAAARFIIASELLAIYKRPLLICDIDATFSPEIGRLFSLLSTKKAAFLFKGMDNHFPWRSVSAGLCYLTDCDQCHNALTFMARYLWSVFEISCKGSNRWWCDQNALVYAIAQSGLNADAESFFKIRHKLGGLPIRFAPHHNGKKEEFLRIESDRLK